MSDPTPDEEQRVRQLVFEEARRFLDDLEGPVCRAGADAAAERFGGPLPEEGDGAPAALRELVDNGREALVMSAGPRFFHFVVGGATPAALGADWLASVYDQIAASWVTSPLAVQLELVALGWLRDLFGLPDGAGVMTTGAHMANVTCLGAARQWWGAQHGVDVAEQGLSGLPPMPVFSSGYFHASGVKALAMLGTGRAGLRRFSRDPTGSVDLAALETALRELNGAPAVLVANAGEVNAGDFDPIDAFADLAEKYGAWLHVDGAFGLFAAVSPKTAHLVQGIERADSVTVDGHKWLNVPYDCGFAFVREQRPLAETFRLVADYLPPAESPRPVLSNIAPEASRRARSFAVWATLRAYGRGGVRRMVEHHLSLAQRLAARVDEAPELERLADVSLNIVCFRFFPPGARKRDLDQLNQRLGQALLADGRVYVGTTRYAGRVALRPAIVNWRSRPEHIDLLVEVVRELAARL